MSKSKVSQIVTVLFLLSVFANIGYAEAFDLYDVKCVNTTALNVSSAESSAVQHCAWGCKGGQCITGESLALNAAFVLLVTWGIAFVLIWISNQIGHDEDMSKTVLKILGLLMMVIGVLAALGIYNDTPHIGATIRGLLNGIATSFPEALVLLALFVIVVKIMDMAWKEMAEKGWL